MTPTLKYDVRGVESGQDFDEPIPKGVYRMTVLSCIQTKSSKGNDMLELELEIIKGKYKGRRVWDYVVLTKKSEWKLASLVRALGMKEKGSINPEKLQGKTLTAKVKLETYTTEDDDGDEVTKVTNKIASLLPKKEAEEADEEEEEGEEAEEEEADGDEEEEEESDEEEDEDEDGDEEGYTEEEINGSSKEELKEIISDEELEIRVTKKTKVAALRKKVLEALEEAELMETEEEDEPEEDEEGDEEEQDYSEMSLSELKEELKERELKVSGKKPALIKRLEKDDEEEEDEGGDDDGDEPF